MSLWEDRIGRWLLALLFAAGAIQKAIDPTQVIELLSRFNLPTSLVWPALAFNAFGTIGLILGIALPPLAYALAGYCIVTSLFHFIPDDPWQMSIFIKNLAIAGGLLILASRPHPPATA